MGAALDRPTQERAALLTEACAGDAELRAEVESLIAWSGPADEFLETGDRAAVLGSLAEAEPEAPARARIGAYKVLREIGRGGMGAVFLAERDDHEYRKRVAIKLVSGTTWTPPPVVHRFRQERQILAELDHPNIARLLDGGTTDEGAPYFVMEHVEGTPLDALLRGEGALFVEERLALFRTVCAAVGVAHQKLVVHRDLKPGNILVTARGHAQAPGFRHRQAPGSPSPPGAELTVITGASLDDAGVREPRAVVRRLRRRGQRHLLAGSDPLSLSSPARAPTGWARTSRTSSPERSAKRIQGRPAPLRH